MKFPKNRENVYVVIRRDTEHTALLGVFSDILEADDYKDACAAEWFDKTKDPYTVFDVRLSTYYG